MRAAPLSLRALNRATLARQGLLDLIEGTDAGSAVRGLGSLQAQHPEWPPIALAARAADGRTADLAGALDRRSAVRSSLMRITIHVVAAEDLWPMFVASQPLRLRQWRILTRSDPVDSPLGRRMTACACRGNRARSASVRTPPSSSIGSWPPRSVPRRPRSTGPPGGSPRCASSCAPPGDTSLRSSRSSTSRTSGEGYGRSLYALAEDWLGDRPEITIEAARTMLARRYLGAFGPASVDDLSRVRREGARRHRCLA